MAESSFFSKKIKTEIRSPSRIFIGFRVTKELSGVVELKTISHEHSVLIVLVHFASVNCTSFCTTVTYALKCFLSICETVREAHPIVPCVSRL